MKTITVTLTNQTETIERTIKTRGSAKKAANALAYTMEGFTAVCYKVENNTCKNEANSK
jgi:hypothetical protein